MAIIHFINRPKSQTSDGLVVVLRYTMQDKKTVTEDGVKYAETNLNLENNIAIRNMWNRFESREHKRRRSFVKKF